MNCRVCGRPLVTIAQFDDMPAIAQRLSDTPEEHSVTLFLCQCSGCGLVQLDNLPVWYWQEEIRTSNDQMDARITELSKGMDFVSCNRLEHVPNPNEYLKQFNGRGVIEVPNFNMIYSKSMFAEIMLDHLLYFTEDTLRFTLQYNGFEVIDIQPVWDYYILSAQVRRRKPLSMSAFDAQQKKLKLALDKYISQYEHVAIYGASHQAFAYIATLQPKVDFIVDDSPMKQGKYSPVGGLLIRPPYVLDDKWIGNYESNGCSDNAVSFVRKYKVDAVVIMGAGYSDIIADNLIFDGGVAIMRDWGVEVVK